MLLNSKQITKFNTTKRKTINPKLNHWDPQYKAQVVMYTVCHSMSVCGKDTKKLLKSLGVPHATFKSWRYKDTSLNSYIQFTPQAITFLKANKFI